MTGPNRFTLDDLITEARAGIARVSAAEAETLIAEGALLLDTRQDTDRWRNGAVAGSLHMPRTVLEWVMDPVSGFQNSAIIGFDQTLIVMCAEGYSSSLAAYNLQRLGFRNATDLIGGFEAWRAANLPVQEAEPHDPETLEGRWPPEPTARPTVRGYR